MATPWKQDMQSFWVQIEDFCNNYGEDTRTIACYNPQISRSMRIKKPLDAISSFHWDHIEIRKLTSPIPMKARTISKKGNPAFAAKGVRTVAMDHQTTPNPRTRFPPTLSAHIPPAIYQKWQERHYIRRMRSRRLCCNRNWIVKATLVIHNRSFIFVATWCSSGINLLTWKEEDITTCVIRQKK